MKKILAFTLAVLLMVSVLPLAVSAMGEWKEVEDGTITEELLEIFTSAASHHTGIKFVPLELLATQTVAGMNYKFRCWGTTIVMNPKTYEYIVIVYRDPSGNCSITEIENLGEVEIENEWVEAEDQTVTAELKEIFEKAVQGYLGMEFEPLKLLATQMVSGMNYKFLCKGTSVSANPEVAEYVVIVYRDLKGNCSVFSVERVSDPEPVPVPPTGDASLAIWIALLLASVICAAVVLSEKKRIAVR